MAGKDHIVGQLGADPLVLPVRMKEAVIALSHISSVKEFTSNTRCQCDGPTESKTAEKQPKHLSNIVTRVNGLLSQLAMRLARFGCPQRCTAQVACVSSTGDISDRKDYSREGVGG